MTKGYCHLSASPILRLLFMCLTLIMSSHASLGQDKPDFVALQQAVALLMDAPIARDKTTKQSVIDLRERVDAIQRVMEEGGANTRAERLAVQHLTTLLIAAAKEEKLPESKAILDDIRRDLDLKIQYYRSRMGVVGAAPGFVSVTVRTLRDGKEVKGLTVHCNPPRYRDDAPANPFPSLSSPTQTLMVVGFYRCFASLAQTRLAFADLIAGQAGSEAVTLDILVPSLPSAVNTDTKPEAKKPSTRRSKRSKKAP